MNTELNETLKKSQENLEKTILLQDSLKSFQSLRPMKSIVRTKSLKPLKSPVGDVLKARKQKIKL